MAAQCWKSTSFNALQKMCLSVAGRFGLPGRDPQYSYTGFSEATLIHCGGDMHPC